jgi:transposase InsO family protein
MRRLGSSANSCARRPAEHKDHVRAWDFLHDRTSDGRPLKWFTLVDEDTRECLALEVDRGMTAQAVSAVLAGVVRERGAPWHIRSGNGPGFIAKAIRAWVAGAGQETLSIGPGAPWENG